MRHIKEYYFKRIHDMLHYTEKALKWLNDVSI